MSIFKQCLPAPTAKKVKKGGDTKYDFKENEINVSEISKSIHNLTAQVSAKKAELDKLNADCRDKFLELLENEKDFMKKAKENTFVTIPLKNAKGESLVLHYEDGTTTDKLQYYIKYVANKAEKSISFEDWQKKNFDSELATSVLYCEKQVAKYPEKTDNTEVITLYGYLFNPSDASLASVITWYNGSCMIDKDLRKCKRMSEKNARIDQKKENFFGLMWVYKMPVKAARNTSGFRGDFTNEELEKWGKSTKCADWEKAQNK